VTFGSATFGSVSTKSTSNSFSILQCKSLPAGAMLCHSVCTCSRSQTCRYVIPLLIHVLLLLERMKLSWDDRRYARMHNKCNKELWMISASMQMHQKEQSWVSDF
jgi:hypothetical protein